MAKINCLLSPPSYNLIIILNLLLLLTSCTKEEARQQEQETSITGTWILIEKLENGEDGLPAWRPVDQTDSYSYTFHEDGSVINSRNNHNCQGAYQLNSILNITYHCDNSQAEANFDYTFEGNHLILTPKPNLCDEGCARKFVKTN